MENFDQLYHETAEAYNQLLPALQADHPDESVLSLFEECKKFFEEGDGYKGFIVDSADWCQIKAFLHYKVARARFEELRTLSDVKLVIDCMALIALNLTHAKLCQSYAYHTSVLTEIREPKSNGGKKTQEKRKNKNKPRNKAIAGKIAEIVEKNPTISNNSISESLRFKHGFGLSIPQLNRLVKELRPAPDDL